MHLLLLAFLIHIVKPGDTLWGMVGNRWSVVCYENHIRNCDLIYPGQKIRIPEKWGKSDTDRPMAGENRSRYNSIARSYGGNLGCSGLERLWDSAGGNPGKAFIAAEIAMAESSGEQYATGPAGERGYWQINPDHGYLSTYNPYGNAKAAVIISGNGTDWTPWTTYTSGAYLGRCGLPRSRKDS